MKVEQGPSAGASSWIAAPTASRDSNVSAPFAALLEKKRAEADGRPEQTGVERYAVPGWMGQYLSPVNDLSVSDQAIAEARGHNQMMQQFMSDGVFSAAERDYAQGAIRSAPATSQLKRLDAARLRLQDELKEFAQYRMDAYDSSLRQLHLTPGAELNQELAANPALDQKLHASFREALLSNPRAVTLMKDLGVG